MRFGEIFGRAERLEWKSVSDREFGDNPQLLIFASGERSLRMNFRDDHTPLRYSGLA